MVDASFVIKVQTFFSLRKKIHNREKAVFFFITGAISKNWQRSPPASCTWASRQSPFCHFENQRRMRHRQDNVTPLF